MEHVFFLTAKKDFLRQNMFSSKQVINSYTG